MLLTSGKRPSDRQSTGSWEMPARTRRPCRIWPSRDARSSRRRTRHRTSFDVSHAVAWAVPESANAGVRVTRLAGEGPCWLPVTSLAPEGGWDYRHYRRARKWIEHFAGDSEVPVLPL